MCGRFTLTTPEQDLALQFDLPEVPTLPPRYNIAPTQPVAVVRGDPESARRELAMLHWGLIPFWAKDRKMGARLINARSETAAVKPSFRAAFRQRRCLVLADGFYEWQKLESGKQPVFVHRADGSAFAFAGLWERWKGRDEGAIESCTLLTTEPNELVRPIHNRMPVILHPEDYDLWLDTRHQDVERLNALLRPFPEESMEAYPVSRFVNSPRNDGPQCIEPLPETGGLPLPGL